MISARFKIHAQRLLLALLVSCQPTHAESRTCGLDLTTIDWTETEKIWWSAICDGAPITVSKPNAGPQSWLNSEGCPEQTVLSDAFLRTIIFSSIADLVPSTGIYIHGACIKDNFSIDNANFQKPITFHASKINRFSARGAKLQSLAINDSVVNGNVFIQRLEVKTLSFRGTSFSRRIDLSGALIDGSFDLSGSSLIELAMPGAKVARDIRLGWHSLTDPQAPPKWHDESVADFRGAHIEILQDAETEQCPHGESKGRSDRSWPKTLHLDGFTFSKLGTLYKDIDVSMVNRCTDWWNAWLRSNSGSHTPTPYRSLANAMLDNGKSDKASSIMYESRSQEHKFSSGFDWLRLSLLWIFVGYGYSILSHVIFWVIALTVTGSLVLKYYGELDRLNLGRGISYSFDMLLPIVKLDESNYTEKVLIGKPRYYFYFHKIMGYLLATYIAIAVSGLAL